MAPSLVDLLVWEKVIGMHDTEGICLRALARLHVVIPIWFLAFIFPFFGPINSAVGALLVTFTVYVIPGNVRILTFRSASARQNAAEESIFIPSLRAMYVFNASVMLWVLVNPKVDLELRGNSKVLLQLYGSDR
ncbi:Auxin transporter protein 1, partial [Mucuna pruriens]